MLDLSKNEELKSLFRSSKPNMKQDLSQYAAKNIAEFIAESWAEYVNNPTPRPLAKQVGDIMNAEYQKKFGVTNPNTKLINQLTDAGADLIICGQSAGKRGMTREMINPNVKIALSATTALIQFQNKLKNYGMFQMPL